MTPPPKTIGVAGAGTMGAGIAQLACLSGARTLLHDPVPEALQRGIEQITLQLERGVERGRLSAPDAGQAKSRLEPAAALADLAPCELVIEAAPETLEIKRSVFARLADDVVEPSCVLATRRAARSPEEARCQSPRSPNSCPKPRAPSLLAISSC